MLLEDDLQSGVWRGRDQLDNVCSYKITMRNHPNIGILHMSACPDSSATVGHSNSALNDSE
jgi:hypothetical protein